MNTPLWSFLTFVLRAIPRGTRLLYLHSYQSFIWNHVATKRLETMGSTAPVVGTCSIE